MHKEDKTHSDKVRWVVFPQQIFIWESWQKSPNQSLQVNPHQSPALAPQELHQYSEDQT